MRDEVKKCDQEIQSIKAALRGIAANSPEPNSVEIEFTNVRKVVAVPTRVARVRNENKHTTSIQCAQLLVGAVWPPCAVAKINMYEFASCVRN